MKKEDDPRYPFTYSADLIRGFAGYNSKGMVLSRGEASNIGSHIAEIIGMDEYEFKCKMADYYLANEEKLSKISAEQMLKAFNF